MTAYERRRRAGRRRHEKRMAKKARPRGRVILKRILIFLIILILAAGATAFAYISSKWNKVEKKKIDAQDLSINHEIEHETGFLNVALFGLDSRDDDKGVGNRSDTMMIASLNKETGEIKLVSVYRDTLLELGDGSYNKANAAYSFGDADAAVALLNRNLDLDVEKYISCTFKALVLAIDAVGGLDIDVKEEEVNYVVGYEVEIIKATGIDAEGIKRAGRQHLNGTQATAWARIRYTEGGDFTRTERQREVITKLAEKLKKCDAKTLNKIVNQVFPEVKTNFSLKEILSYVPKVSHYAIGETMGFPKTTSFTNLKDIGSCVIADDFENDVISVHKFLFGQGTEYAGSDVIRSIAAKILDYKGRGVESDTYDNSYDDTYAAPVPRQQYNNNNNNNNNSNTTQDTGGDNTGGGAEQDTGGGGQDTGGGGQDTGGGGNDGGNSGEIIQ